MPQLASDDFNRADSTGLGANWSAIPAEGSFDIVSAGAVAHALGTDSAMFYNAVAAPDNQYSEVIVRTPGAPGVDLAGAGVVVRASAGANTYYRAFATGPSGSIYLRKRLAGVGTGLGNVAGSIAAGQALRLTAINLTASTLLILTINGVVVLTAVDASAPILTGNWGMEYSATDSNTNVIESWSGGSAGLSGSQQSGDIDAAINAAVN